ncbi:methyl-accepting chemotaxis protein [Haloimpatiens sp. FM7330]|uniref:methyl-accepting chemotaxis protein n=1 Tax=Haloimpatiens sp. FM7330 TaxID=3298610 RepID=UPI003641D9D1
MEKAFKIKDKIFKNSIKNKISFTFLSLVLIMLILVNGIIYFTVYTQIKKDHLKSIENQISQIDESMNNYISMVEENFNEVKTNPLISSTKPEITTYIDKKGENGIIPMKPLEKGGYEAEVYNYYKDFIKVHPSIKDASLTITENGGYVLYPAKPRKNGYDPRTRTWYKSAESDTGAINYTDAYVSSTGNVSIVLTSQIKDSNNKTKGVVALGLNLDKILNMIKKMKIGDKGYVIITDKKGNILADPKHPELVTKNIKELKVDKLSDINAVSKDPFEDNIFGEDYLIKLQKSTNEKLNWNYVICIPKSQMLKSSNSIGFITLMLIFIFGVLSIFISRRLANKIAKPISEISEYVEMIGKGDFSIDIPKKYLEIKDETGSVARAINNMQQSINNMLGNVKNNSQNLQQHSSKLFQSTEQMALSSKEVANAIEEVAKGTEHQSHEFTEITSIVNRFTEELGDIVQGINNIQNNSKNINDVAKENNKNMELLIKSVEKISDSFKDFVSKIEELGINIKQVNEITDLINSIAEQTNLLALNAAIEAARAGEAGKGFSVVAEEIRKLAEQTQSSSKNINELINGISNNTNDIVKNTDTMNGELNNQVDVINNTIDSFKNIINGIEKITPKIESVDNSAKVLDGQKNNILSKIESVSAISEEVSASAQQISASSEEMTTSTEGIKESTKVLSDMSDEMMRDVNKFKLEE